MSLSQGSASSSSSEATALGELLLFAGAVADYAAGAPSGDGERIGSLACAIAAVEELDDAQRAAAYFGSRLRNLGAIGNAALRKGETLPERARMMALRDIPAQGARLCELIKALPSGTADVVRWQAESYDGTGYPDQLRWTGIPRAAQIVHIATVFVTYSDPEEALPAISAEAGRAFAPEQTRSFLMWYHTRGGEIEIVQPPFDDLDPLASTTDEIVELLAAKTDEHNASPARSRRVARTAMQIVRALEGSDEDADRALLSGYLYGIGELRSPQREDEQFDPLSRLGIETRAEHAHAAAKLLERCPALAGIAPIVGARAEWFDGSGKPQGRRANEIPLASQALALAIAHERLEETRQSRITGDRTPPLSRLETAAGTQFDPRLVRALQTTRKAAK